MQQEQIEKAAWDYSDSQRQSYDDDRATAYAKGFKAGAVFALSHQWISVKERLPEEKKAVLCYMPDMKDDYAEKDMYFDMAILLEGKFINLDAELICPSHWMSIPIPQFNTKNNDRDYMDMDRGRKSPQRVLYAPFQGNASMDGNYRHIAGSESRADIQVCLQGGRRNR